MKKLVSFALAIAMLICGTVSAFASDYSTYAEVAFVNDTAERFSETIGVPVNVTDYQIVEDDDFKIYSVLVQPVESARSGNTVVGYGLHTWKDKDTDTVIGEIYATAHFEYNGSSATVVKYYPQAGSMNENSSYVIKSESHKNSTAFTKAYYKFTYSFKYFNTSKTATVEVNCTKDGVLSENYDFKYITT